MKSSGHYSIVLILLLLFDLSSHAKEMGTRQMAKSKEQTPVVVFVCEHGSAKSILAAAHFNALAKKRGLRLRAISRGTNPDEKIAPSVANGLQADGVEVGVEKPARLSPEDASGAIRVVAFCPLPKGSLGSVPIEEWKDVPSTSEDYSKARDDIVERVKQLLDELKAVMDERRAITKK